ncbi:MAG: hypothetical protein DHS80DRAFT_28991 [Piptocephalis tieghemiana]|nr:MAG: hypothetical protein DHS80DRAFT_28991 [Piptocephalis tieghemiana]
MKLWIPLVPLALLASIASGSMAHHPKRHMVCEACIDGIKACRYICPKGMMCTEDIKHYPCSPKAKDPTSSHPSSSNLPKTPTSTSTPISPSADPTNDWICEPCYAGKKTCHPYCPPGKSCTQMIRTLDCGVSV